MKINSSLTVMVPCYNAEKSLRPSVNRLIGILDEIFLDYEIIIFDDCSPDRTGEIADALALENPKIKVVHNEINYGVGYNFRRGAVLARKDYYFWLPPDDTTEDDSLKEFLRHVGEAELIISYNVRSNPRPVYRALLSASFTKLVNFLFRLNLKYYCGVCIYGTKNLAKIKMHTNSFAMQMEVMVQMIKGGVPYKEYPLYNKYVVVDDSIRNSSLLRPRNIIGVVRSVAETYFDYVSSRFRPI